MMLTKLTNVSFKLEIIVCNDKYAQTEAINTIQKNIVSNSYHTRSSILGTRTSISGLVMELG